MRTLYARKDEPEAYKYFILGAVIRQEIRSDEIPMIKLEKGKVKGSGIAVIHNESTFEGL